MPRRYLRSLLKGLSHCRLALNSLCGRRVGWAIARLCGIEGPKGLVLTRNSFFQSVSLNESPQMGRLNHHFVLLLSIISWFYLFTYVFILIFLFLSFISSSGLLMTSCEQPAKRRRRSKPAVQIEDQKLWNGPSLQPWTSTSMLWRLQVPATTRKKP